MKGVVPQILNVYLQPSHLHFFIAGCITSFLVLPAAKFLLIRKAPSKKVYALHHGLLNMRLPPETMWMNMGHWEVRSLLFPLPSFSHPTTTTKWAVHMRFP